MSLLDIFKKDTKEEPIENEKESSALTKEKEEVKVAIGKEQIKKANQILQKYKNARGNLEKRIVENEQFWKLRQWDTYDTTNRQDIRPASAWLWNCIVSKHADFMDGFPSPNILPRMIDDEPEANRLSAILPMILDQSNFKEVYDDVVYYKLKHGSGVYGVFWDSTMHNGLGDIAIKKIDLLKLFVEPGVTEIQDSANVFLVELVDNEVLENRYPVLKGKLKGDDKMVKKYIYDDSIDTSNTSCVVDWYYKKETNGIKKLHYVKYCGDTVIYASENDTEVPTETRFDEYGNEVVVPVGQSVAEKGWYAHGKYPFVVDTLFGIEGSIAGYGYTDIGKDVQREIDVVNQAIVKNTIVGARPRYFIRNNGSINEKEFSDWNKDFIHCDGNLGQDSIRPIDFNPIHGHYIDFLNGKINEIKEVTGNRDVNSGGTVSGVTAASAIAALQEAGSKQSRDAIAQTYSAYKRLIYICIELMRERYDLPRYFRIMGEQGEHSFVEYTNEGLVPQPQGNDFGIDMGFRTPEFDIEVTAEKESPYKKMERNELAVQLYQLGVFAPQNVDSALPLMEVMDFAQKDKILQQLKRNGTMYDMLMKYQQLAFSLAQKYEPQTAQLIAQQGNAMGTFNQPGGMNADMGQDLQQEEEVDKMGNPLNGAQKRENAKVERVRENVSNSTQPL